MLVIFSLDRELVPISDAEFKVLATSLLLIIPVLLLTYVIEIHDAINRTHKAIEKIYGENLLKKGANQNNFSEKRVLLVDDNENNLGVAHEMLLALDVQVLIAKDGEKAVAVAKKENPDLILMDLRMPKKDGFEAVTELRAIEAFSKLPIIAWSASTSGETKAKCLEKGFSDHLPKPLKTRQLVDILEKFL